MLVWHTDRLHRSPRELEDFITLAERKRIVTETVTAGSLDLNTPSGRMVARMLGAAARQEVEHKSERTKRAQLQAAQAGRWRGGSPPIGWNVREDGSATLNREAARRIRKASADVLAGVSMGSIVAAWNAAGFTSGTGRRWNYATLRQVLTRARNAGLLEYNGAIVGPTTWPAIVTEDTWRSICSMLADPARRRSTSNRAKWLLAGIAVCGKQGCGARLRSATVGSNGAKRAVYRCTQPGAGHVARAARPLDALIDLYLVGGDIGMIDPDLTGHVDGRLGLPDLRGLITPGGVEVDGEDLNAEAVTLRARLTEAANSFADGGISSTQLKQISTRVQRRLEEVESQMTVRSRSLSLTGIVDAADPVKAWKKADIDRRRAVVRELMTVTVMPSGKRGRVFDPTLVAVEWRTYE